MFQSNADIRYRQKYQPKNEYRIMSELTVFWSISRIFASKVFYKPLDQKKKQNVILEGKLQHYYVRIT